MLVLGLDLETTGLSFDRDHIIEVGLVVYETDTGKMLDMLDMLVRQAAMTPEAVQVAAAVAGLSPADLLLRGLDPKVLLELVADYFATAEAIVAHNGTTFDRPMLEAECRRHGVILPDRLWIDTQVDVPYPDKITTRKLTYLAVEHGFLNPFPHRAIFDVVTMLWVMSKYPFQAVLESAKQPTLVVQAVTTFDQKDLAKEAGFYWKPDRKQWLKAMKPAKLEELRKTVKFPLRILEGVTLT